MRKIVHTGATSTAGDFQPLLLRPTGDPAWVTLTVAAVMAPVPSGHDQVYVRLDDPSVVRTFEGVNRPGDRSALRDEMGLNEPLGEPGPVLGLNL